MKKVNYCQMGKITAVCIENTNYDDKVEIMLDNYEIKEENGKYYAVKKKPKYPTNYKECCDVLKIPNDKRYIDIDVPLNNKLLSTLTELLICRDAYWKIAGEEMGLGKPWKPDWNNVCDKYTIYTVYGKEIWRDTGQTINTILAFPTKEMRDAFYENFKELIEQCKELL